MIEFKPKVSIIIPVYNGSNYLRQAVDSALSQTYLNTEVIIVNDGSDDGGKTEEIALSYGKKVRYLFKENGGVSTALNCGIREMEGEWFAWLSHDDRYSPDRIETDMNVAEATPDADAHVVFCIRRATINGDGKIIKQYAYPVKRVITPWETLLQLHINMCSVTIHKSCFEKTGLFNESNRTTQDVEMALRLSKYFTFYGNKYAVTYLREHAQRGTYTLKEQHKRDLLLLAGYLKMDFSFTDLFPDSERMSSAQRASAWSQLGNIYCYLGDYEYADTCYRKGYLERRSPLGAAVWNYILGARMRQRFVRLFIVLKRVYRI